MAWMLSPDVARYLASAGVFLRSRPAEHSVLLTVAEAVRIGGPAAFGDDQPLFGWYVRDGGAVTAACLHTPPYPVALTAMPDPVAAALAWTLAGNGRAVTAVGGPPGPAQAFAAEWQQQTGQPARVGRRERLYRLGELVPPAPAPAGQARVATGADIALLLAWLTAFHEEADPAGGAVRRAMVDERIGYGGLTVWETGDGPVSLAGRTRAVAGQARIGPVTTAVSQQALAAGVAEVLLYTDLANPTSNALYQRLGYQPVTDRLQLRFTA
jgi:hypothetical protein